MGSKRSVLNPVGHATMRDVARQAGVSVTTVSKVLNHIPYVSKVTQRRVEEAIAALGFQPNASAQQLQGGASRIIALDLQQAAQVALIDLPLDQMMDSAFLFKLLGGSGGSSPPRVTISSGRCPPRSRRATMRGSSHGSIRPGGPTGSSSPGSVPPTPA